MARRVARRLALLGACMVGVIASAAFAQLSNASTTASPSGFLLAQLATTSVYQAAMVERALTDELLARFPLSAVRCVDMRVTTTNTTPAFDLLFLVGETPFALGDNNGTVITANATLSVDIAALETNVSLALASLVPLSNGLSLRVLPPSQVQGNYSALPSLQAISAPPSPPSTFLRVDMSFRNLLSPANLTQSLLFQTRRGIQRFLGLASLTQVTATGPPQVPAASVLLLAQSFWVTLNNNATDATVDNRQRLANLLIYGDPTRLVMDETSGTPRPAMFLDFAVDSTTEPSVDPTVLLTLPYVFSSLSVDVLPAGNAPAPEPALPPGSVVVPATPTSELLARVRKRHVFQFVAQNDSASTAAVISSACPSTTSGGGICVKLQWNNTLNDMPFWVESIESLDALAWNIAPSVAFCASRETPLPLLPSPTVPLGLNAVEWALAPLTATTTRVAFALNLRSLDADNATRVKVEISCDIRSALQAATTVTSIARRVDVTDSTPPLYATRSNVVVAYDTTFRAASNEIALALTLQPNDITQKDTSQPCAHCQNLYEWCTFQASCQALANCVFRDGLETAQTPATLFQQASFADSVVDVSPVIRSCLSASTVQLDALLLFASAVRCQLQRQCSVRKPADYSLVGIDDRVLLWEAGDGVVQLTVAANSTADNVTLRLLDTPLCSLAPLALASTMSSDAADDYVSRQCAHAGHLGRVQLTILTTSSSPSNTTLLELRFQDLIGPLPTVEGDWISSVVTALPALRLRLERADFATALPPLPAPPLVDTCQTVCRSLALDGCLRDPQCVTFTDCVVRATTENETTGDALLRLFEQRQVGATLSLRSAVTRCMPSSAGMTSPAWRQLVRASACYAKHGCALSLQGVVLPPAPDGDAVVGKWSLKPSPVATQRLFYEQQTEDAAPADMVVPLTSLDDTATATTTTPATTTSAGDAVSLAQALRLLLQFDDLDVRVVANTTDASSGLRGVQWEISYAFWLGALPRVMDTSRAPRWRLVDMPLDTPTDFVVEMVARDNTTDSSSDPPASTLSDVEIAVASAVPVS